MLGNYKKFKDQMGNNNQYNLIHLYYQDILNIENNIKIYKISKEFKSLLKILKYLKSFENFTNNQ